jgi:vacuolar-type H+-ATPase subunit F/Vma7
MTAEQHNPIDNETECTLRKLLMELADNSIQIVKLKQKHADEIKKYTDRGHEINALLISMAKAGNWECQFTTIKPDSDLRARAAQ